MWLQAVFDTGFLRHRVVLFWILPNFDCLSKFGWFPFQRANNNEQDIDFFLYFSVFSCILFVTMDLHDAARNGNLELVRLLVEQGADKDEGNGQGNTTLYLATCYGHLNVVQYLVQQGASLDKAGNSGITSLSSATAHGNLKIARYLLEQGADRDKADNSRRTPLHKAAQYGHLEIAMLLMSYGADLNARTNDDELPIDITDNEEIRQAIRDEPRRRMDEAPGKRAIEQDRHPNAATSVAAQEEDEDNEVEQSNKRPCLDEGAVAVTGEETKVAEEDEDSEPSSDENDE